jgi:hypothetical protein
MPGRPSGRSTRDRRNQSCTDHLRLRAQPTATTDDFRATAIQRERRRGELGRVGMKRLTPLPRQVSSSPAPNRTCEFPRIRLSMRGQRHGCPSQRCEGEGRFPELVGSLAEAFGWVVPSVRYA